MKLRENNNEILIKAVLSLKTLNEAKRFLHDLMTEKEIIEFSKRLHAAELLTKKISYSIIKKKTGLSSTTIARVSKCINSKKDGYKTVISRLDHSSYSSK